MNQTVTNSAFPLSWPPGRPRAERRERSNFDVPSFGCARDELLRELRLLGARDVVISTNVPLRGDGLPYSNHRNPDDPGVAVYFTARDGRPMAFACDRWQKAEDNLRAVQKTIEALRGISRWGTGDMRAAVFTGFAALPAPTPPTPWWEVLGVSAHEPTELVTKAYRRALMHAHPDHGGSGERVHAVEAAYASFKQDRGL
jgi:hypothetical protein